MDVVITSHPKDYQVLSFCINGVKKNIKHVRTIYVITPHEFKTDEPGVVFVPESKFPFTREDVRTLLPQSEHDVVHWYLQQLLKVYAQFVIPDLSEDFLVIDSDAVLLKPLKLFTNDRLARFGYSGEYTDTDDKYSRHMKRLNPSFTRFGRQCGIVDFQVWNRSVWCEIIEKVEGPFWKRFLECVEETQGASEYELYFHYYTRTRPHELMDELERTSSTRLSELSSFKEHIVTFHSWQGPRI